MVQPDVYPDGRPVPNESSSRAPWWEWACRCLLIAGLVIGVVGPLWIGISVIALASVIWSAMIVRTRRGPTKK
jgi:hypothetical protein